MAEVNPDSEQTRELLQRIQDGDRSAFDELFARHRPRLYRLVQLRQDARMQARVDASDVVQESQLETFRRLPDYLERRPMPFRLWLRKTLEERLQMLQRQHLGAARRSAKREQPIQAGSNVAMALQLAGIDPSPSQAMVRDELAMKVRSAVEQLDDLDREILLMRTFEGLSYSEIAYVLDVESAAARKRHGRALLRLHKLLKEGGLTESQL